MECHGAALSRCFALSLQEIETYLIQHAGLTRASRARTRAVTVVQRCGSALNLNVHLPMLVLGGVYTSNADPCGSTRSVPRRKNHSSG